MAAWLEDQKVPSLCPGQGNLVNKDKITINQLQVKTGIHRFSLSI